MAQQQLSGKLHELRLLIGGFAISDPELRKALALLDDIEQCTSSPGTDDFDKENASNSVLLRRQRAAPPSHSKADSLNVSCISNVNDSNASTVVLQSPVMNTNDDDEVDPGHEYSLLGTSLCASPQAYFDAHGEQHASTAEDTATTHNVSGPTADSEQAHVEADCGAEADLRETSLTSASEAGDVLSDLPTICPSLFSSSSSSSVCGAGQAGGTPAQSSSTSDDTFGISPSPSLTANAVKRRRRAKKNEPVEGQRIEETATGEEDVAVPAPVDVSVQQVTVPMDVQRKGQESQEQGSPPSCVQVSQSDDSHTAACPADVAVAADAAMTDMSAPTPCKEGYEGIAVSQESCEGAVVSQPSLSPCLPLPISATESAEKVTIAAAAAAIEDAAPPQDAEDRTLEMLVETEPAAPDHYQEHEQEQELEVSPDMPKAAPKRNSRRQSVSGRRLKSTAKPGKAIAATAAASADSDEGAICPTTEKEGSLASVTLDSSSAQAVTSMDAGSAAVQEVVRPRKAARAAAVVIEGLPLPAQAVSIAEQALVEAANAADSVPLTHPFARAFAVALVAAYLEQVGVEEAQLNTLAQLASLAYSLCVLLLPVPQPGAATECLSSGAATEACDDAPSSGASPLKRRRVAFAITAGASSSPPNDRRPASFLSTLADANRLHDAIVLCERLLTFGASGAVDSMDVMIRSTERLCGLSCLPQEAKAAARDVWEELQWSARKVQPSGGEDTSTTESAACASMNVNVNGGDAAPSPLRFRLSWMLSAVIRYNLRWLLDAPPPHISAPQQGGTYIEIDGVRSVVQGMIKVVPRATDEGADAAAFYGLPALAPAASVAGAELDSSGDMAAGAALSSSSSSISQASPAPGSAVSPSSSGRKRTAAQASSSKSAKRKPAPVDHCHIDTADIPLSALVTYALRQLDLERRTLEKEGLGIFSDTVSDVAATCDAATLAAAWRALLSMPSIQGSLLLQVECQQVMLAAAAARGFLLALLAMPPMLEPTVAGSSRADPWISIQHCASVLSRLQADERHLVPLRLPVPDLLIALRAAYPSTADAHSDHSLASLLHEAAARLDQLKRAVALNTASKRVAGGISLTAEEREGLKGELQQHGLIFDFPGLELVVQEV